MTTTIEPAAQGVLTGTLATLYTVPTNRIFVVKGLTFFNPTGAAVTLVVEAIQSSGGTQRRYIEVSVTQQATHLSPEIVNHVLGAGGIIQASGDQLTFLLSGVLAT